MPSDTRVASLKKPDFRFVILFSFQTPDYVRQIAKAPCGLDHTAL